MDRIDTLNTPVFLIMSCVKFSLLTATEILLGSVVTWITVLTIQPLSLAPSLAVRTKRPYDRLYMALLFMLFPFLFL